MSLVVSWWAAGLCQVGFLNIDHDAPTAEILYSYVPSPTNCEAMGLFCVMAGYRLDVSRFRMLLEE